jgi:hypothetical protein
MDLAFGVTSAASGVPSVENVNAHLPLLLPSGVIKRGNGKSIIDGGFNGDIIYKWVMFHCHV